MVQRVAPTSADIVDEARRLLRLADEAGVTLRLLGGAAVRLRAPGPLPDALARDYGDLDFAAARGSSGEVSRLFRGGGYEPHVEFNALHGKRRLMFLDLERERKADVFVGEFAMCHSIPIGDRLDLEAATVPLAELLLTKLQIVELNEKDVRDTVALLDGHEVAGHDGDAINASRIAALCAADWGLWRTITANLDRLRSDARVYLDDARAATVERRVAELRTRLDAEPKSRGWRLRARVGERVRWYELPEEALG